MRSGCKGHLQASKRLKHVENDLQLAGKQEVDVFGINNLLTELAESRKVFHSEADFQHALAWHIHQTMPESQVRLEFPMPVEHRKMYVDIWLPVEKIAIELKYMTRKSELEDNEESFALRNQGAQNQRRYDFLWDIHRLELMRSYAGVLRGWICGAADQRSGCTGILQGGQDTVDSDFPRSRGTGDLRKTGMVRPKCHSGNGEAGSRVTDTNYQILIVFAGKTIPTFLGSR